MGPSNGGNTTGIGRPYRMMTRFVVVPSWEASTGRLSTSGRRTMLKFAVPLAWRCEISSAMSIGARTMYDEPAFARMSMFW